MKWLSLKISALFGRHCHLGRALKWSSYSLVKVGDDAIYLGEVGAAIRHAND